MSTDAASLFNDALALPQPLRAELAAKLLESLKGHEDAFGVDYEDFEDVLARRSQEMRDGTVIGISAEESIASIRRSLAERRKPSRSSFTPRPNSPRKKAWQAPPFKATRATLYKYIKSVKSASEGCVTDE